MAVRHPPFASGGSHPAQQASCQITAEGGTLASLGPHDIVLLPDGTALAEAIGSVQSPEAGVLPWFSLP